MPTLSVVVPIYNVERYLTDCLESLAQQTFTDLEVILVDDGATDSSATIAAAFAERDDRFQLVRQPNGGLGNARNTGADRATGDYIAFVDSDDVVVRNAYELLVGSLEATGSDFASGNYHRLTSTGTRQAGMVTSAFTATRLRTHVTKHAALLNDRTAWNKVFRRSFWTHHGFRWPEGVLYEDIPVTLPAHVLAESVDVLRQPIYLWRARVGDSTSITQRRTEPRAIRDRTSAVDGVSRFMAEHGDHDLKKRYDRAVAEQDLKYFLQQLDAADEPFRALFLDLVNDFFDRADDKVFDPLPAIDRLKWHLVRRRLMPELLEVLRFEKSGELPGTPVVRRGRSFYGNYPFRGDAVLQVPDEVYKLDRDELPLRARIEDIHWEGDRLVLEGFAYIAFFDLSKERSSRIRLTLEEAGHPESVVALHVRKVSRPDVTAAALDGVTDYTWSGFEASVDAAALRQRRGFRDGQWRLRIEVRSHGIMRRRWVSATAPGRATRPDLHIVDGARLIPTTEAGQFALQVSTMPAHVDDVRVDGDVLEFAGELSGIPLDPATAQLRLARVDGTATLHYPVAPDGPARAGGRGFLFRLPLSDVLSGRQIGDAAARSEGRGDGINWEPSLLPDDSGRRIPLSAGVGHARAPADHRARRGGGPLDPHRPLPGGRALLPSGRRPPGVAPGREPRAGRQLLRADGGGGRAGALPRRPRRGVRRPDRAGRRPLQHRRPAARRAHRRRPRPAGRRARGTSTPGSGPAVRRCASSSTARCSPTFRRYVAPAGVTSWSATSSSTAWPSSSRPSCRSARRSAPASDACRPRSTPASCGCRDATWCSSTPTRSVPTATTPAPCTRS